MLCLQQVTSPVASSGAFCVTKRRADGYWGYGILFITRTRISHNIDVKDIYALEFLNIFKFSISRVPMQKISREIFHEIYEILRKKSIFLFTFVSPCIGIHTDKFPVKCFN